MENSLQLEASLYFKEFVFFFFARLWRIWIELNNRVFKNKSSEVDVLWIQSSGRFLFRQSQSKDFVGVSIYDLNFQAIIDVP